MLDPFKGFDGDRAKDRAPWRINLCRQRVRSSYVERTAYSLAGKDKFYVLEKFAKL